MTDLRETTGARRTLRTLFARTVDLPARPAPGTVTLRARFPNPTGVLLPGMFVTAMFDQAISLGRPFSP